MICGATLLGLASQAQAQQAGEVAEVVVTGSRIPQPNLTSVSPVTTVGAQDVQLSGITRTEDLINQLPQVFAAQGSTFANGATGTATVDLRGLGPNRTLVLIDGRRLQNGTPGAGPANTAPDLNFVPAALIERVEVVTGGASAVYGADAVAGVVNFIMQKNFEGVRLDAQYSGFQHTNDHEIMQEVLRRRQAASLFPEQFATPEKDVWDGGTTDLNLVVGINSPDDKGNITAYVGYRNVQAITQDNRDFSACNIAQNTSAIGYAGWGCAGSGTTAPAMFVRGGGSFLPQITLDPTAAGGRGFRNYNANRDGFNFAPYNFFQRPDTRYTLGAFANYEFNEKAEFYAQLMFMDDYTSAQIAPSGIFGQVMNVNCQGNPYLTAAMVTALCAPTIDQLPDDPADPSTSGLNIDADPVTPGQQAAVAVFRRNVEGGPRVTELRHTSYRGVLGMRGELDNGFQYDVYAQRGTVVFQQASYNDFSIARAQKAMDVVIGPDGQAACRSAIAALAGANFDPACRPYDPFSMAGPSQASIEYLQTPGFQKGEYIQTVVSASITGDLGQYGVKAPWANDGVGFAVGAEYRRERLDLDTDVAFQTGDLAGAGGQTMPSEGSYDLYEMFGEVRVPLVQERPFFEELSLELGFRWSDYSLGFSTDTYKIAGDWAVTPDVRLRAGYNRAIRAPNIVELFATAIIANNGNSDPCEGPTPDFTREQCARTGVSAAQYGNIVTNIAGQYNGLIGGNPDLEPETADTYTAGVVFTPTFLPGFNASVDWYRIKVRDMISTIGQDTTLETCGLTGDPFFCGLIHRAPGTGSLWLAPNGYVEDITFNTGGLEVEGFDFEAAYRFDFDSFGATQALANYGGLTFNFTGSLLQNYKVRSVPGAAWEDCAGLYGSVCTGAGVPTSAPLNEWRHRFRTTWRTPWDFQLSATWRHMGSVEVDQEYSSPSHGTGPDKKLKAQNYLDLAATWSVRDDITFRFGVNNVFDNDPPLVGSGGGSLNNCPTGPCNGNTYPQVYDANGRYLFFGVRADF